MFPHFGSYRGEKKNARNVAIGYSLLNSINPQVPSNNVKRRGWLKAKHEEYINIQYRKYEEYHFIFNQFVKSFEERYGELEKKGILQRSQDTILVEKNIDKVLTNLNNNLGRLKDYIKFLINTKTYDQKGIIDKFILQIRGDIKGFNNLFPRLLDLDELDELDRGINLGSRNSNALLKRVNGLTLKERLSGLRAPRRGGTRKLKRKGKVTRKR